MIVCSCNVFSDHQVRSALANATQRLRMSQVYDSLGGVRCGRCAHTIKAIMEEMKSCAINPVAAVRACTLPCRDASERASRSPATFQSQCVRPRYGVPVTSPGAPIMDVRPTGT